MNQASTTGLLHPATVGDRKPDAIVILGDEMRCRTSVGPACTANRTLMDSYRHLPGCLVMNLDKWLSGDGAFILWEQVLNPANGRDF